MNRVFQVSDARGERQLGEADLPLSLGGAGADIQLPGVADGCVLAYIASSDGHAYVQAAEGGAVLFHNHEHLSGSAWLKSGDQVQLDDQLLHWQVKGDRVFVSIGAAPTPEVVPPPPATAPRSDLPLVEPPESPGHHGRLLKASAAVLVLLAVIALFVLMAVPLEVRIEPAPQSVSLRGALPVLSIGERQLAWPGSYRLTAQREGYYPLDEKLVVQRSRTDSFHFQLRELPGQLFVRLDPQVPFRLFVDGEAIELHESVAELDRGEHLLRVETDLYLPVEQRLEVTGFGKAQTLSLQLQPAWAEVTVRSEPAGAQVSREDEALGVTPVTVRLIQGERWLRLQKALFKTAELSLDVVAGEPLAPAPVHLVPVDGQLELTSTPTAATLRIDGQYRGTTPVLLPLSSGEPHRLQLTKPGYSDWVDMVTLQPGEPLPLQAELAPAYGTLFIEASPADAQLRVDGKEKGNASQRLCLTTRPHRLEVYREGYLPQRLTVTPDASASRRLQLVLKTEAQAKIERTPAIVQTGGGQTLRLVRPEGILHMGASRREAGRRANESPRQVRLKRAFYFGDREVTNAQFRAFRKSHNSGRAEGVDLNADNQPVVNISHDDAARYANWLSRKQGLPVAYREAGGKMQLIRPVTTGYRLPTEAEWAYVARRLGRQSEARYPWTGAYPPNSLPGNFADRQISDTLAETVPGYDDRYRGTAPVGSFVAFPEGFYDLGGNVAEWMSDFYGLYPGEADRVVEDPLGPERGKHYVVRGSSWRHGNITELRLSYRDYSRQPRADLGFRLARYAD